MFERRHVRRFAPVSGDAEGDDASCVETWTDPEWLTQNWDSYLRPKVIEIIGAYDAEAARGLLTRYLDNPGGRCR